MTLICVTHKLKCLILLWLARCISFLPFKYVAMTLLQVLMCVGAFLCNQSDRRIAMVVSQSLIEMILICSILPDNLHCMPLVMSARLFRPAHRLRGKKTSCHLLVRKLL